MRKALRASSFAFSAVVVITGCSSNPQKITAPVPGNAVSASALAGNWSFALASPSKPSQIAAVSGSLSTNTSSPSDLSGTVHVVPAKGQTAAALCYARNDAIAVSGTIATGNAVKLTSTAFIGNVLTIAGTWDVSTHSLTNATLAISGSCGYTAQPMLAQQFASINGTYTGTFDSSQDGPIPVSATLTQTSQPDANGTFHLQGSATFPADSCITSPVVTDSSVTGSAFSATYTDASSGATVTAIGSFNQDATTLTITSYTLTGTGGCSDSGTGSLSN